MTFDIKISFRKLFWILFTQFVTFYSCKIYEYVIALFPSVLSDKIKEMVNLFKSLGKEKVKTQSEKYYHKSQYLLYYSKKLKNGDMEFWAHPQYKEWTGPISTRTPITYKKSFYLGIFHDGEMIKADNFYSFEMGIQRGAFRAFRMAGIYE